MPQISKKALSQYIRTECLRRLRLDLSPDTKQFREERELAGMPPVQPPRRGLEYLSRAGEEWQDEKVADLCNTFGDAAVIGHRQGERFGEIELTSFLQSAPEGSFLVEAQFETSPTFEDALGVAGYRDRYGMRYAMLRPDLIEVLPVGAGPEKYINPAGDVMWLAKGDPRVKLRVIDIKLTAGPTPSHFAEVTYYSMALAGWLVDHGLDEYCVVVPTAAIWPGSHEASSLVRSCERGGTHPAFMDMWNAMQHDLETAPFEVFAGRIKHFFRSDVPGALAMPWDRLPWHVDSRCKGCDYLGYPWVDKDGHKTCDPRHCMPMAERMNHLSRIAFMSRSASCALSEQGISDVATLAEAHPDSDVFDEHYSLRASRNVVAGRASSLRNEVSLIPPNSGTSSMMPGYADLHIYLMADFDVGSAITFSLGVKAFWVENKTFGWSGKRDTRAYRPDPHVIDTRDLSSECMALIGFLEDIHGILDDAWNRNPETTVQFYIWDTVRYKHLARVIGRHMQHILIRQSIQYLAWLFPPEELLPNADMEMRRSYVTIVCEAVRTLVAAPIPHYYSLLSTARVYHDRTLAPEMAQFNVHPLFEDPLSDQIPSERAHEIWARAERPRSWQEQKETLRKTVIRQLDALETITRRLEDDLKPGLKQRAPKICIEPPKYQSGISVEGQLWYGFARLDAALGQLEVQQIRAMPPEEREARYQSARLTRRLTGDEETRALGRLGLQHRPGMRVYEMRPESKEVKAREGDFTFALSPERVPGFLDKRLQLVTKDTPLERKNGSGWNTFMETAAGVRIVGIDRDAGIIAVSPDGRFMTMLDDLEKHNLVDFSRDVILDPTWIDTFGWKLNKTLHTIGNPRCARDNPIVRRAVGLAADRRIRETPGNPVADVLWSGRQLAKASVPRELRIVRQYIESGGISLNESQWEAWEAALSRRLQIIWGPPGTGKSRTLTAVVMGAVADAVSRKAPLRMLVCAPTYNAMDNVLLDAVSYIGEMFRHPDLKCVRIRSSYRPYDGNIPRGLDLELNKPNPSPGVLQLYRRLMEGQGITVVGATPEQVHNLLMAGSNEPCQEMFDFIILDEASQIDVGHAILAFASLAEGGTVVVAGDPKQLPPIHQAKAPAGLEDMVGSIYEFFENIHGVRPAVLRENYRSNRAIVDLAHEAGYDRSLTSFSPGMKMDVVAPFPADPAPPEGWPRSLLWSPSWSLLLDPAAPVSCFLYPEGRCGQWNPFEASSVAALVFLLYGRLASQPLNERDPLSGAMVPSSRVPYAMEEFWKKGIGIVTPHRAQQALIISKLQQVFEPLGVPVALMRGAVDTVERFQGQQRDVVIASYAMGDQEAIQSEDEFLMSLNRFNVMVSRARTKLIVFATRELVNHLSGDLEVLRDSRLLKVYVESFCNRSRPVVLGELGQEGKTQMVEGELRWRG